MSFTTSDPVVSGHPYRVVFVDGAPPSALEQFIGVASFVIANDGAESQVRGQGRAHGLTVRFHQKDADHAGKDARTWQIAEADDGFSATPIAAF